MERPKNLLRPGYWSWYTILLQRRSWCPCLLPPGSKFWICIPGAPAINLKMMSWSGRYKADREFGYLQINVSSNSACTQGGSVYIIWVRHKADKSNTDWCKFYEESIYQLSKGQKDSAARLVEIRPIGQKSSGRTWAKSNPATSRFLSTPARRAVWSKSNLLDMSPATSGQWVLADDEGLMSTRPATMSQVVRSGGHAGRMTIK